MEDMDMRIEKTVSMPQGKYEAVEREVVGFNAATHERGIFRTAAEHGCRWVSCRQHWNHVPLPPKTVRVSVEFDEQAVAEALAMTAARNKTGRAIEYGGLLKAKVLR
jgi:hypothetical protein